MSYNKSVTFSFHKNLLRFPPPPPLAPPKSSGSGQSECQERFNLDTVWFTYDSLAAELSSLLVTLLVALLVCCFSSEDRISADSRYREVRAEAADWKASQASWSSVEI